MCKIRAGGVHEQIAFLFMKNNKKAASLIETAFLFTRKFIS